MTWQLLGHERNLPPAEAVEQLRFLGGENRYGEPNFKIAWAQYETFISGGTWSVEEATFTGYRRLLVGSGEPCWALLQWHAPEEYGTPESFYLFNIDESSGLQNLGEYPYAGRFEILYHLRWHEKVNDKLEFFTLPLTTKTFDLIVPVILQARDITLAKRKEAYLLARQQEEDQKTRMIERHLQDKHIPFKGGVSYSRQGIRSTVIDQKMVALQRSWNDLQKAASKMRKGMSIG